MGRYKGRKIRHCPVCKSVRYFPIDTQITIGWQCKVCGYMNVHKKRDV